MLNFFFIGKLKICRRYHSGLMHLPSVSNATILGFQVSKYSSLLQSEKQFSTTQEKKITGLNKDLVLQNST